MQTILTALSPTLITAWKTYFSSTEDVVIVEGDITKIPCDAIVSPANSFGFMDGGLDYALSERFGWDLEKQLQRTIKELPEGELLVGQALVIETNDHEIPFLISAPTMRIPTNFNINTSVNAYLVMKAILIKAKQHPSIQRVAIPGLCTGIGQMEENIAAKQMFQAYKEIVLGEKMNFSTFGEAQKYHWELNPKGMIWVSK
ncbi:macro domain-containing protein [Haliscomenobacter hydrossis]|uniref:Appr-1-p processing domain protein n=1 Tax=Haliscomenobacter hydrossis (strain ATCC 27775 / DSM 1100 / LMG 10767 / O) TaxID=760192 RepID=F4KR62_HALH1|nr:macro domain-containing protein [Haliscomenobacter hydrossis]AEE54249.1 Appr-1-p processing domain protein [Haliscomenobacter hydrossis DSM 1100]